MEIHAVVSGIVCSVCLLFHLLAVGVLLTTSKLHKSRFKKLVLCLSISDIALVTEVLVVNALASTEHANPNMIRHLSCSFMKTMIFGTMLFSLLQTLFICLERLNATYTNNVKVILKVSSNKAVGTFFVICHLYGISLFIINLATNDIKVPNITRLCLGDVQFTLNHVLLIEAPLILLCSSVVTIYPIVIARIIRQFSRKPNTVNRKAAKLTMIRTTITVSVVIFTTLVSFFPRSICAVISLFTGPTDSLSSSIRICNLLILLNPLLDPFVYVIFVKDFRKRLKDIFRRRQNVVFPDNS